MWINMMLATLKEKLVKYLWKAFLMMWIYMLIKNFVDRITLDRIAQVENP